jgi:hypothetical protein
MHTAFRFSTYDLSDAPEETEEEERHYVNDVQYTGRDDGEKK